jgi:predicted enzyme related to lactoylglutathione lyase
MVYLEHINLVVADIPTMLRFYQTVFPHWKVRDEGEGDWYGKPRKWCHFGDDFQYIALNNNGEGENRNLKEIQVGLAHFAYVVNSLDAVIKRLNEAGYEISTDGNENPFRRNVYFIDPAGFEVEFVEYLSDIPAQRNSSI